MRTLRETALAVVGAMLLVGSATAAQSPEDVQVAIREAAARHGVSGEWLVSTARCESRFNPRAVGRAGELGLFQLLPGRGLLVMFYERGHTDPWDMFQQSDFAAWAFARGLSHHWTCS